MMRTRRGENRRAVLASWFKTKMHRDYQARGFLVLRDVLPVELVDRTAVLPRSMATFKGEYYRQNGRPEPSDFFPAAHREEKRQADAACRAENSKAIKTYQRQYYLDVLRPLRRAERAAAKLEARR